jgi:SHS family lactate transporter-like MFS transporter
VLKLWAFSDSALWLALGAFAMQFSVQGAWGVIPVHLNELSPDSVRGTLPGLTYQIGNFISSIVPWLLALLAEQNGKQYGFTMAVFIAAVVIVLIAITAFGPEAKDAHFGDAPLKAAPVANS